MTIDQLQTVDVYYLEMFEYALKGKNKTNFAVKEWNDARLKVKSFESENVLDKRDLTILKLTKNVELRERTHKFGYYDISTTSASTERIVSKTIFLKQDLPVMLWNLLISCIYLD